MGPFLVLLQVRVVAILMHETLGPSQPLKAVGTLIHRRIAAPLVVLIQGSDEQCQSVQVGDIGVADNNGSARRHHHHHHPIRLALLLYAH